MNDLTPSASPTSAVAQALQARELAEAQTRYIMARRFPRDQRKALDNIVNAFSRPRLAERAAYEYVRGGDTITGPSIHAAQAIAQQWGNMEHGFREVSRGVGPDGVPYSEVLAFANDVESLVFKSITFHVPHWRDTKKGGYRLRDERDIYELSANMAQRRTRACILAVIPQDVVDVAMEQAEATMRAKADTSPEAIARMVEAFEPFGVTRDHLEKFTGRRLDAITPALVLRLKRIYTSLRDEVSTPAQWFDMGTPATPPAPDGPFDPAPEPEAVRAIREAMNPPPVDEGGPSLALSELLADIAEATDRDTASLALDVGRSALTPEEYEKLSWSFLAKFPEA